MWRYHETIHTGIFHRKGYLMLHHLAGATIKVAYLVNYNCTHQEDGNKHDAIKNIFKVNNQLFFSSRFLQNENRHIYQYGRTRTKHKPIHTIGTAANYLQQQQKHHLRPTVATTQWLKYILQNNWRTNAINYNIDEFCVERISKTNFTI